MTQSGVVDVLVVDDSDFFVEVTAEKLAAEHDVETVTASDGQEALARLADTPVDCIVSDYQMPSMNGLELFERVDAEYGVPFILLTGQGTESVASEAIGAGVDDYLQKDAIIENDQLDLLANRIQNIVSQHRTREKYERLVEHTPDEIAEVTLEGKIVAANAAMATSLGTEEEALLGRELSDVLPERVAETRLEHGRRALTAGSAVSFQDNVGVRHFHNIAVPLEESQDGESVQYISREITQQKRDEQKLKAKTEQFEVINRIVRHDINNDVQMLLGWADGVALHVDEEGQEYVDRILDTCDHIAELTSIARDFVDSIETDDDAALEPVAVDGVVTSEVEKKQARFDDATITVDGALPSVDVCANELLSSVIANLVSNAVRHNDAETPAVRVSVEERDTAVRIAVADNGPGISEAEKEEIFGKGEMDPESPGTGIGLYLVHTLVDQYGGEVWVEDDDETGGAVFVVELQKHE